jgi:hypothetical protein
MQAFPQHNFAGLKTLMGGALVNAPEVDVGEWQGQSTEIVTRELKDVIFELQIPDTIEMLQNEVKPNLPWAEDHFLERVSREPLNPPPSSEWWPYTQAGHQEHTDSRGKFSHTYPERFWPKTANTGRGDWRMDATGVEHAPIHQGIRFAYGDLDDVVVQLGDSPYTRQAYLPVWFPEDTGAGMNQRVPCTLGYHFLIRRGKINVTYLIRSCDFVRHFADDVYMAARLLQWMAGELEQWKIGTLTMWIGSFHIFAPDVPRLQSEYNERLANSF